MKEADKGIHRICYLQRALQTLRYLLFKVNISPVNLNRSKKLVIILIHFRIKTELQLYLPIKKRTVLQMLQFNL
jgi:hypothetical protein